jgi:nucleoside-triphosphatase THEP1
MRIILMSGPVRSGKTTALMEYIRTHPGWGGFLSPDTEAHRILYRIRNGEAIPFETKETENGPTSVSIGKFHFLQDSFRQAGSWITEEAEDPGLKGLILDEIGKLELLNRGFHEYFSNLLKMQPDKILVVVVRDTLVPAVIDHYALKDIERVTRDTIGKIF